MKLGEQDTPQGGTRWLQALGSLSGQHPDRPQRMRRGDPIAVRLIAPLALVLIAAAVACTVLGFVLARQSDDALDAEHRRALRSAVETLHAASPNLSQVEPHLIRILEQASGFKGLRFESEPAGSGRETQSLIDRSGRIVGWFNWEPERPATAMMVRLLPFGALIALGLFGFVVLALWQLRRLGFLLATTEQQVQKLSFEDPTTGLPNERDLFDRLDEALAARAHEQPLALAVLDLENFGEVKDAVGEAGGEEVALEVATRLRAVMPADVVMGRLRIDRFALVMPATSPEAALSRAEAARDAIARAVWVNQAVQVRASIGIALAPRDGATRAELMHRAKLAMRGAKKRGSSLVVGFVPDMETEFDDRRFIKRELGRALAAREFQVHYQPIVSAEGSAIVGVEALLRWHHAARGLIPPSVFVPIAEEAGLMDQLGEFVLRRALSDAARWPDYYIGVNLSPVQVRERKLVNLVSAALAESGVAPQRLVLEMTESVLIDEPEQVRAQLEALRALGVKLALDDFGSGYSSLTYLQRLPFDKLKVDRGFVAALNHSANAGVIIQAVVALGRALGMSVLIEGVETEEQRVLLRLAGCNEMQGFLFARPMPREEIDRLLAKHASDPAAVSLRATK